jgi:hypothetical protein
MQGIVISELIESYVPYLLNCNFRSMPIQFLKLKTKANLKRIGSKDALHFLWFQMKDDDLRRKFYKKNLNSQMNMRQSLKMWWYKIGKQSFYASMYEPDYGSETGEKKYNNICLLFCYIYSLFFFLHT